MNPQNYINMLGKKVQDRVTGMKGTATSVSFDLYGCIQVIITPSVDKKGHKMGESGWYDANRLVVLDDKPVMQPPNFVTGPTAEGRQGAADKPNFFKS